ncbi:MAG TPA: hypothetical protein VKY37_03820 [Brumimicrobium sp.]|nr:hypothetical protein [Brumimicrobium sp.]
MKHNLLSLLLLISVCSSAQEIEVKESARHSFYLIGGVFSDITGNERPGFSSALGYQIYFPNRFVFGVEVLTDQTVYKHNKSSYSNEESWARYSGVSGRINLGYHLVKRKHFDFSLIVVPHFNHGRFITRKSTEEEEGYKTSSKNFFYLAVPLIAQRFELYYKINPTHALGLNVDINLDVESKTFSNIFKGGAFFIGRLMLSYRVIIPGS